MDTETARHNESASAFLRRQHREIRSMLDEIPSLTGEAKQEMFDCLRRMLAIHETAEEQIVHPAVRRAGDAGERAVKERLAEEGAAKQALADLEKISTDDPQFDSKFTSFADDVLRHADAEEQENFPLLEAENDQDEMRRMAKLLETAERMAPTHPHPHGPDSALGNLVVGPFAAMADRVRDMLSTTKSSQ